MDARVIPITPLPPFPNFVCGGIMRIIVDIQSSTFQKYLYLVFKFGIASMDLDETVYYGLLLECVSQIRTEWLRANPRLHI